MAGCTTHSTHNTKFALQIQDRQVTLGKQHAAMYRLCEVVQIDAVKMKQVVAGEAPSGCHNFHNPGVLLSHHRHGLNRIHLYRMW